MVPSQQYPLEIATMRIKNGRGIKAHRPNNKGFYEDIPCYVIGKPSASAEYDPKSFHWSMNSETSKFNIMMKRTGVDGEVVHPFFEQYLTPQGIIGRLRYIDRTKRSHRIYAIRNVEMDDGTILGLMTIKCKQPYGKMLEEDLQDPDTDSAFSVRVWCYPQKKGERIKRVREFVTIDAECTPGWEQAAQRYSPSGEIGTESYKTVDISDGDYGKYDWDMVVKEQVGVEFKDMIPELTKQQVGTESIESDQLCEMLNAEEVLVDHNRYYLNKFDNVIYDTNGNKVDPFTIAFRR